MRFAAIYLTVAKVRASKDSSFVSYRSAKSRGKTCIGSSVLPISLELNLEETKKRTNPYIGLAATASKAILISGVWIPSALQIDTGLPTPGSVFSLMGWNWIFCTYLYATPRTRSCVQCALPCVSNLDQ